MPSLVEPVDVALLPKWHTKRLLQLRNKLLRCEASLDASDVEDLAELDASLIRFKDDPRWQPLYDAVRAQLSTREHVPRSVRRAPRSTLRATRK